MRRRFYVQPPTIPGIVYNGRYQKRQCIFVFLGLLVILFYLQQHLTTRELAEYLLLTALGIGLFIFRYRNDPNSVYMDQFSVRADFGNGIIVREPLENYFLAIGQAGKTSPMTSNYCYRIFLAPKNNALIKNLDGSVTIPKAGLNRREIPIRNRILTPENLKENVEAIQSQIASPLKIAFASEQLERDYISGKFKAS